MGNFDRGGRGSSGGYGRGSDRKRSGGRDGGRPAMHRATCGKCGDSCEVPFKPTGDKPVFCSDCFGKQDSRGDRGDRGGRDNRGGRSGGFGGGKDRHRDRDREMHDVVCTKCEKDCQVPFKPTSSKPIFCSDCFGKQDRGGRDSRGGGGSGELVGQVKMLNDKIDKLIDILAPKSSVKKDKKTEVKKAKAKVAPKKAVKKATKKLAKKVAKKAVKKKVAKKKVSAKKAK